MLRLYISDNVSGITKAQVNCDKAEGYDDKYSSQFFEFDQQNIKTSPPSFPKANAKVALLRTSAKYIQAFFEGLRELFHN